MAAPERFADKSDSSCTAGTVHTWPITSLAAMQRYFRSWTISGHCADCREAWRCAPRHGSLIGVPRSSSGSLAKFTARWRASSLAYRVARPYGSIASGRTFRKGQNPKRRDDGNATLEA